MKHAFIIMAALLLTQTAFAAPTAAPKNYVNYDDPSLQAKKNKDCPFKNAPGGTTATSRTIHTNYWKPQQNLMAKPSGSNSLI